MQRNKSNEEQIEIARKLNLDVTQDTESIAAARILEAVYSAIYPQREKYGVSREQIEFAESLDIDVSEYSRIILSAIIADKLHELNVAALQTLGLQAGDKVLTNQYGSEKISTISSISQINCRLWFKGGNGRGAWPSQVIRKVG